MKTKILLSISVLLFIIYAFDFEGNHYSVSNKGQRDTTKLPPVETKKANSDYKPAFAGQTRIGGVRTVTPYKVEKISENLGRPWAIVPMPDGRLLISEKSGYAEIFSTL